MLRFLSFFLLLVTCLLLSHTGWGRVDVAHYGLPPIADSVMPQSKLTHAFDSIMAAHPQFTNKVIYAIEHRHIMKDKTVDFYLLLSLCMMLGLIRMSDFRYFQSLWRAFWNPSLTIRQLKDQTERSAVSNFLMNIFFTMSGGAYIYYIAGLITPQRHGVIPPSLLVILLIFGMMAIYSLKYGMIKFSGWAFKVEGITESYIFNMFLINKIIGIALLPFIIFFAFADAAYIAPLVVVSFIITAILLLNRYARSWRVFGSFFQYSKFHFFTYLCASELLPLAVLMKIFVKGMLYY